MKEGSKTGLFIAEMKADNIKNAWKSNTSGKVKPTREKGPPWANCWAYHSLWAP